MSDINSNIKYIKGVSQYRVTSDDEILNVDTSDGAITIVLPNIKAWQLLFSKPKKVITVNDYSRTASTNSITIIANNNNINGLPSLILDADGDSSTFSPVDNNEWFGDKQPSGGGGVSGANNGVTLNLTTVQLGGALIIPTTITADATNTLTINDATGVFLKTRDAGGSFLLNNIGSPTFLGTNSLIFSYLGDASNSFKDSNIVINFGGANSLDTVTDFWNFGDYTTGLNSSSIFNIGRYNSLTGVTNTTITGYSNTLNSVSSSTIIGTGNVLNSISNKFILGNNNLNLIVDGITGYITSLPSFTASSLDTSTGVLAVDSSGVFFNTQLDYNILAGLISGTTTQLDPVISVTNVIPTSPTLGDRYLAGTSPVSPWTANYVEEWNGSAWVGTAPVLDDVVFVTSTLSTLRYNGTSWIAWIGTAVLNQGNTTGSTLIIGTNTAQAMAFKTNNIETARVVSGGSWGFGTPIPSAKVSIKGQGSTSATMAFDVRNSANILLFSVRNDGFTSIGTSTPLARLYVYQGTIGTSTNVFKVDILTWGEVFSLNDDTYLNYTGLGANFKGSNGTINIVSNGGVNPQINFKYNNGSSDSGLLYGVGSAMFMQTPMFGVGSANFALSASLHVKGIDSTSSNYALKVDNSASSPLLYVRNDGLVSINSNGASEDTNGNTINTTDATANVTAQTIAVPTDKVISIESTIVYRKTGGAGVGTTGDGTTIKLNSSVKNVGGTLTLDTVQNTYTGTTNAIAGVSATYTISGTNVLVSVTGVVNDNITWNVITKVNPVA